MPREHSTSLSVSPNFLDTLGQTVCSFARSQKYNQNHRYGCVYLKCTGMANMVLLAGNVNPNGYWAFRVCMVMQRDTATISLTHILFDGTCQWYRDCRISRLSIASLSTQPCPNIVDSVNSRMDRDVSLRASGLLASQGSPEVLQWFIEEVQHIYRYVSPSSEGGSDTVTYKGAIGARILVMP